MKPTYENIFQYILVALCIGLVIAFANYLLGFSKEQRSRRREAKLAFQAVFKSDLESIVQSGGDARLILNEKEKPYEEAKNSLRKYLLFWQLRGFDKAWEVFYYHPENKHIPFLSQYMDFGSLTKRKECYEKLTHRINALLAYAKVQP